MNRKRLAAALAYVDEKAKRLTSLDQPKESDAVDMALEMGGSFIPGVGQALAARDFERARRADDEAGMAMAAASALPVGRLIGALKGFDPVMREIDVYHGSPHVFDEFDASKIGTGEGAQAYGHGIYLAESPDVAKVYRSATNPVSRRAEMTLQMTEGNVNEAIKFVKKDAERYETYKNEPFFDQKSYQEKLDTLDYLKQTKKGKKPEVGAFYTADLPDEMVDRMLDWDKPLSEQSQAIKKAMGSRYESWKNSTGQDLYEALSEGLGGDKATSDWLRENNISGIRYLDAGSRGQGGSGTRNFVVFPGEEKKVKILKRE